MAGKLKKIAVLGLAFLTVTAVSAEKKLMEFKSIDKNGKVDYSKEKKVTLNTKSDGKDIVIPEKYDTPKEMMRTTWVASVDNMHFPKKVNGKIRNSEAELKRDWLEILDKHEELNFNTVIFQVSPTLDALYESKNRPWAHVLTGKQGTKPEWAEEFDLVGWMIEETHKRGMEFHAWFNPYRVTHVYSKNATYKGEMAKLSKDNFAVKNPETVYMFDNKLYLDPGYDKVKKHITDSVGEFLEKYDVDAIHFDDYFYPYKIARDGVTYYFGDKLEDRETFRKNRRGFQFIEDISTPEKLRAYNREVEKWRRDNNDIMVHAVKSTIEKYNNKYGKSVQWGISPFGIWEHQFDNPAGTDTPKNSTAANRDIYADTKKWVDEETIDYIIPQVYWEFAQPAAPYGEITSWWNNVAQGKRTKLYIGHADYKHMNAGRVKAWENPEEIGNQLKFNNRYKNIEGSAFFGYSNMVKVPNPENKPGITAQNRHIDYLKKNFFSKKVLVPGRTWLDKHKTEELKNVKMVSQKDGKEISFRDNLKNDSRFYAVYSGKEIVKVVGRDKKSENQRIIIKNSELKGKKITGISIKDRAGVETKVTPIMPDPTSEELNHVGELIYKNETGGKRELLVHWNIGEEFPSLGLGHFIWYPENFKNGKFDESFPGLVEFYKTKGIKVPNIIGKNRYAPWKSREEFLAAKNSPEVIEVIDFLDRTKDIQVEYIYERSQKALEKMMKSSKNPEHVKKQYERVAASPNGIYPLIDYVNFKGEGIKESERYKGQGWGLLQVLESMEGEEIGQKALDEFSKRSTAVLRKRVENSPPERGEKRWMANWESRCKSYSTAKVN